jgi:chemotaxis methyl-accepting protein methylase
LLKWVFEKSGLEIEAYRSPALDRRLPACLRLLRVPTTEHARDLLERRPDLIPRVLGAILIGVSDFFRDAPVFAEIERHVLPRLLAERERVRVCSLGCSGGQELYSVAMLVAEAGALDRVDFLGLDRRPEAVWRAARGRFAPTEVACLQPERLARFFEPDGTGWRARPDFAARLRWQAGDLLQPLTEAPWDLVLCRNVLIYLRPERSAAVWETLRAALLPGGYLITGKAEKAPPGLPLRRLAPSIYRRAA